MTITAEHEMPFKDAEAKAPPRRLSRRSARVLAFQLIAGVAVIGAAGLAIRTLAFTPPSETTDDAYVAGDQVAITSREPGIVTALYADNTESVRRGAPLLDLDASTAQANLEAAYADLARTVRMVRSAFARLEVTQAQIAKARDDLARAQGDLARRQQAEADQAVSGEEVSHALEAVRSAQASLDLARGQHAEAEAAVQGATLETNPDVLAAIAAVRRAAIVRQHMHITAPADGVVAQRNVQLGQQVSPGAPLMAVVPLGRVWVDANFRETQLADLRVGQPATVRSDAYGRRRLFHGKVLGLGAGTGAAFSLLPPQNASGNWIKIVQRLPVRIGLDPAEVRRTPLRVGLSATVTVDTRDHSGTALDQPAVGTLASEPGQDAGPAVEATIARIIRENAGGRRV
jgi:membrane fusion protein (multidrug efflux system)